MKFFKPLGEGLQAGSQAGTNPWRTICEFRVCGGKFSLQRTV